MRPLLGETQVHEGRIQLLVQRWYMSPAGQSLGLAHLVPPQMRRFVA